MTFTTSHLPRYLQVALASEPARPRLTWYDDDSGGRVELSAQTLTNWVVKTMNLLIDDVGVEQGSRVSLHMPLHWLAGVWLVAADACGATIADEGPHEPRTSGPGESTEVGWVIVDAGHTRDQFAVSLAPLPVPLGPAAPTGGRDFCAEVRAMPDELGSPPDSGSSLAAMASVRAEQLGLAAGDRVALSSSALQVPVAALVDGLVAPLAVGGSSVWTWNPPAGPDVSERGVSPQEASRWRQEQVTAVLGNPPPGAPPDVRYLGPVTG